ncbi:MULTISPECIES: LLM class flavin-dependent oxidoreductase [Streptomyces]|uniref:LLM class flavin-dependent oxidoreductase n=1 Tax=Streptomyces TaxID=1883 RepID=UPI000C2660C0|nr:MULTISPECIES: LLM class flavin-dependent oxidoreductase [unclassified Streptomyces]NEE30680.1 LLM class flavin-dependent oxidoreductase [Streptomyces sp. SID7982]WSU34395.1 LLM class flavin-dependent oxidoreductase [Streptomyces gougerotii]MBL3803013.1 LLM class flavin-dependent oxidoreductase [Streptomyces sp. BRB081]MDQ0292017.1 alkanesulfonate monooxygenase [Streptomyces sp. DSM 41037]PJM80247.1 alkanesulfonate monooxygenase [Streptomyces sp. TSRI0384-2]
MDALRFHWCSPPDTGQATPTDTYKIGALDMGEVTDFVQEAEELGVDSLLFGISNYLPDPLPVLGALSQVTDRVKFMLAYRPGLMSPTLFAQVVNTLAWMSDRRISLNIVSGISPAEQAGYGDFLSHDERYARCGEFLEIIRGLWEDKQPMSYDGKHYTLKDASLGLGHKGGGRPEIYISGASAVAQQTALASGDCWLRYGDTPEGIAKASKPVLDGGTRVGTRMHVLARPTREEAVAELARLMRNPDEDHEAWIRKWVDTTDSEAVKSSYRLADGAKDEWLSPFIWTGAVAYRGGPALCIVGSYEEVATYVHSYKAAGVSEFIFSGWPTRDEMRNFFTHVVPLIRRLEEQEPTA